MRIIRTWEKMIQCMQTILCPNTIASHQVASVPISPCDPKSTLKLRSTLHFRHSIVIEAGLGIPSLYFYFCSAFARLFFLYNYKIYTCSAPLIAIDNINTVCECVII